MSTVLGLLAEQATAQRALAADQTRTAESLRGALTEAAQPLAEMAERERQLSAELEELRTQMVAARRRYDQIAADAVHAEHEAQTAGEAANRLDELARLHAARLSEATPVATGGPSPTRPQLIVPPVEQQDDRMAVPDPSLTSGGYTMPPPVVAVDPGGLVAVPPPLGGGTGEARPEVA